MTLGNSKDIPGQEAPWCMAWTNFSLQDEPWAEFSTLEVAACKPCAYCQCSNTT
jgi:hypothetical protein